MLKHLRFFCFFLIIALNYSCSPTIPEQYWQKGNLHTHSLWSDGDDFPEMIIQWYKDQGYQFIALSDHNTIAEKEKWYLLRDRELKNNTLEKYQAQFGDWVETKTDSNGTYVRLKTYKEYKSKLEKPDSFLVIKSEEVTSSFEKKPVHINVTNIQEKIDPVKGSSVLDVMQQTLDAVHAQRNRLQIPMFAHINHPNFGYGISTEDLIALNGERFFEVYNGHPAVHNEGNDSYTSTEEMWDLVNVAYFRKEKPLLLGIATDDSHNYHSRDTNLSNSGRGWVMVNSQELNTTSLIKSLEDGQFYASSGISLKSLYHTKTKLSVEIDAQPDVSYEIVFLGYQKDGDHVIELDRQTGTSASYIYTNKDLFVRAKINSTQLVKHPYRQGETAQAWTQPVLIQ